MWFVGLNLLLATWLLVSAFALPNSPASAATSFAAAIVVAVVAIVAKARPPVRFVISAVGVALGFAALLMPGVGALARANVAIVGALLFALSIISPKPVGEAGEAGETPTPPTTPTTPTSPNAHA
jgi:hypothetical protein